MICVNLFVGCVVPNFLMGQAQNLRGFMTNSGFLSNVIGNFTVFDQIQKKQFAWVACCIFTLKVLECEGRYAATGAVLKHNDLFSRIVVFIELLNAFKFDPIQLFRR